jgi:hypothetical protein
MWQNPELALSFPRNNKQTEKERKNRPQKKTIKPKKPIPDPKRKITSGREGCCYYLLHCHKTWLRETWRDDAYFLPLRSTPSSTRPKLVYFWKERSKRKDGWWPIHVVNPWRWERERRYATRCSSATSAIAVKLWPRRIRTEARPLSAGFRDPGVCRARASGKVERYHEIRRANRDFL